MKQTGSVLLGVLGITVAILLGSYFLISFIEVSLKSQKTLETRSLVQQALDDSITVISEPALCKDAFVPKQGSWIIAPADTEVALRKIKLQTADLIQEGLIPNSSVTVSEIKLTLAPKPTPAVGENVRYMKLNITGENPNTFGGKITKVSDAVIKFTVNSANAVTSCQLVSESKSDKQVGCTQTGGTLDANGLCVGSKLKNSEEVDTNTLVLRTMYNSRTSVFCPFTYFPSGIGFNDLLKHNSEVVDDKGSLSWTKYGVIKYAELEDSCNNFCGGLTKIGTAPVFKQTYCPEPCGKTFAPGSFEQAVKKSIPGYLNYTSGQFLYCDPDLTPAGLNRAYILKDGTTNKFSIIKCLCFR